MPIYEYACRECGRRFEEMRRVEERLEGPACPACAATQTMLVMSAPGHVGAGVSGGAAPSCDMGGGCCGGGACLN
jgi:putative FmdB family regulatory protein